ncbi:MAG: hypothetical protein DMG58_20635 [Acidobacteria bacterium]|nr:MAG: hypothetical protein DMG58_20635 [Acidobacteriota bacterium]
MTFCGLEQTSLFQLGQKTLQGLGSKSGAELLFCSLADYRKGRLAIELLCNELFRLVEPKVFSRQGVFDDEALAGRRLL